MLSQTIYGQSELYFEKIYSSGLKLKPIIEGKINGKKAHFLIDTGSDITLLNTKFLKEYNFLVWKGFKKVDFVAFDGSSKEILNTSRVVVSLGSREIKTRCYAASISLPIAGIIGSDVLKKYNCIINYKEEKLLIGIPEKRKKKKNKGKFASLSKCP
ncbi:MAG: retropepsin-like aspartic protease [Bacteroidota bacterium]